MIPLQHSPVAYMLPAVYTWSLSNTVQLPTCCLQSILDPSPTQFSWLHAACSLYMIPLQHSPVAYMLPAVYIWSLSNTVQLPTCYLQSILDPSPTQSSCLHATCSLYMIPLQHSPVVYMLPAVYIWSLSNTVRLPTCCLQSIYDPSPTQSSCLLLPAVYIWSLSNTVQLPTCCLQSIYDPSPTQSSCLHAACSLYMIPLQHSPVAYCCLQSIYDPSPTQSSCLLLPAVYIWSLSNTVQLPTCCLQSIYDPSPTQSGCLHAACSLYMIPLQHSPVAYCCLQSIYDPSPTQSGCLHAACSLYMIPLDTVQLPTCCLQSTYTYRYKLVNKQASGKMNEWLTIATATTNGLLLVFTAASGSPSLEESCKASRIAPIPFTQEKGVVPGWISLL